MRSANSISRMRMLPFVVMICWLFSACDDKAKTAAVVSGPRKVIPEESWQVESFMSEAAKIKGKLLSPYMLRFARADSPYAEFPRSLHVDFYKDSIPVNDPMHDSLIVESRMDAKYGKYLQAQSKVFLRDSVVVKNILKGDTLKCDELWWDQNKQKFYTDKPVKIYQKDKILFGNGMEADQNFKWFTITKLTGSVLTSQGGLPK